MKAKKFAVLLFAATLGVTSCDDTQDLDLNFGDRTYINDYSSLVSAVNSLTSTLKDRFDALNKLLETGLANIQLSIDKNTGELTALNTSTKDGLDKLNTTLFNGFTALNTQISTTGGNIIYAINTNGQLLSAKIDSNGTLLSNTLISNKEDLVKALNDDTKTLSEKLALIDGSVKAGFEDTTDALTNIRQGIANLGAMVRSGNISRDQALAEIKTAIDNETLALNTKVAALTDAVEEGFDDVDTDLASIKNSITLLKNKIAEEGDDMNESLAELVTAFGTLNTNVTTTNTTLAQIKVLIKKALADDGITIAEDGTYAYVTPSLWEHIEMMGSNSEVYKSLFSAITEMTLPEFTITKLTPTGQYSNATFTLKSYNKVALHAGNMEAQEDANGKTVVKVIKTPEEATYTVDLFSVKTYFHIWTVRVYDARGDYQVYGGTDGTTIGDRATIGEATTGAGPTTLTSTVDVTVKCYYEGKINTDVKAYVFTCQYTNGKYQNGLPTLFWPSDKLDD